MKNRTRNFVKILMEICEEENIDLKSFSYDWIFQLSKNDRNNVSARLLGAYVLSVPGSPINAIFSFFLINSLVPNA